MCKPFILDLSLAALRDALAQLGEPSFRWKQVAKWLYQKRVDSFGAMHNIPKTCRAKLAENFQHDKLPREYCLVSKDGDAVKFGFVCGGDIVESMLLYDRKRRTACVSSQLGCGLGCVFCETGKMGLVRNLAQREIVGQLVGINDYLESTGDKVLTNVVFMGMGEALSNIEAFEATVDIIVNENGLRLAQKRITVSTAGLVPSIERLEKSGLSIGLAVSLNTYSNALRNDIMPINKKYPIEVLLSAAEQYARKSRQPVTFEYVVVHGENDSPEAVRQLARILGRIPCKVNLIPVNPCTDAPHPKTPSERDMQAFADALCARGLTVTRRTSRGQDIFGACGQLAGRSRPAHTEGG